MKPLLLLVPVFILLFSPVGLAGASSSSTQASNPIKHVIVIMQENHTFDNYFGTYPGVNGLPNSTALPLVPGGPGVVRPFHIPNYSIPHDMSHADTVGRDAYDGGKNDGFVYAEKSNYTLGYYDQRDIPYYWDYASQFALADNYFTSFMGPSFPNHLYLIAAQSGDITRNIYNETLMFPSIVDGLQAAHLSWKYYAGGAGAPNGWNPLPIFRSVIQNRTMRRNIDDPAAFSIDLKNRNLGSVVWLMPPDQAMSEHPPRDPRIGEHYVVGLINEVMQSPYWNSTAIFLTWDDYGGWYDHVPPPQVDSHGYGFRVPLLIISPYVRHGFVDHTVASHESILKFIEVTFGLSSLTARDANAYDLMGAFDFTQQARAPLVLPGVFMADRYPLTYLDGIVLDGGNPPTKVTVPPLADYLLTFALVGAAALPIAIGVIASHKNRREV